MNKLHYYCVFSLLSLFFISASVFGQQKEYDKLKDMVDKGKMDKAEEYCDKVTASMAPKTSARFFGLMGLGYYNQKVYDKAAENAVKSSDKKLCQKLAKELANKESDFYDLDMAVKLYINAKEGEEAAGLLFREGKYEESAKISPSVDSCLKYGNSLFDEGKVDESLHYFKRAKKKGQKFTEEKVLDYYYSKKDYKTAYTLQDYGEGNFNMNIQGSVIEKMFENNESMEVVKGFLDSLNITNNKQDEVIVQGLVNSKQVDRAEKYCLDLKQPNQQIALTYMAEYAATRYPIASARANYKLGKTYLAKNQLTDYLIETAKENNDKWEQEPIDKKWVEAYQKITKEDVQKCGQDYCELITHAEKMSYAKFSDLNKKSNNAGAEDYKRANVFLKQIEALNCNKK